MRLVSGGYDRSLQTSASRGRCRVHGGIVAIRPLYDIDELIHSSRLNRPCSADLRQYVVVPQFVCGHDLAQFFEAPETMSKHRSSCSSSVGKEPLSMIP